MFVSENQNQVVRMRQILRHTGIQFVHIKDRGTVKSSLAKEDCLVIILDCPNPNYTDFCFWSELREATDRPVLLLSSDQSDSQQQMAERQQTAFQLMESFLTFLSFCNRKEFDEPSRRISIPLAQNVEIDLLQRCIIRDQKVYSLTKREFQVLLPLIRRMGTPVTAKELLDLAWSEGDGVSLGNLYHYIRKLREKLESNPSVPKILLTYKKREGGFLIRVIKEKVWSFFIPILCKSILAKIHLGPECLFVVNF